MTIFSGAENFFVIVGSSAGALIGLQFVAVTLIVERPALKVAEAGMAFSTPTIVSFTIVMLISALLSLPWESPGIPAIIWGLVGLGDALFTGRVIQHMRRQTVYRPVAEDWAFHVLLPLLGDLILIAAAFMAPTDTRTALFLVAAVMLLILVIGIHNTWDAV